MEPHEAAAFLRVIAHSMQPEDAALIGFDAPKDASILEAAYNDAQGITAQFNLNLLARINRELDADFDLSAFSHQAPYNAMLGRIEMHLVSNKDQTISVAALGAEFSMRAGETIHTESSYKYTLDQIVQMAHDAGLVVDAMWLDEQRFFRVCRLLRAAT